MGFGGSLMQSLDASVDAGDQGHALVVFSSADHEDRWNLNHSLKPDLRSRHKSSAILPSRREQVSSREPSTKS